MDTVFNADGQIEAYGPVANGRRVGMWSFFGIDREPYKTVNYTGDGSCLIKVYSSQPYRAIYYRSDIDDVELQYVDAPAFYLMVYSNGIRDSIDGAVRHGYSATYYPRGGVYCEGRYSMGLRDSTWVYHHPNGVVSNKVEFLNDLPNGIFESYREDGVIRTRGHYSMGRKTGEWLLYDDKGAVVEKSMW